MAVELSVKSRWYDSLDREVTAYKPLQILDKKIEVFRFKLLGMMSEFDHRLLSDAQIKYEIQCMGVSVTECEPSELETTIQKISSGEIPLPN